MIYEKTLNRFLQIVIILTLFLTPAFAQWQNIGPGGGSDLQTILIQPDNPDIVYLGGDIEGIFKTTNGGETWANINNNLATGPWTPDVYWTNQFVYDLSDNTYNTIFYCTAVALFKTTDGGNSWKKLFPSEVFSEDDFTSIYSIAQNKDDFNNLFVGTEGKGIFQSTDGGAIWNLLNTPFPDTATVFNIIITSSEELIVGTTDGVFYSTDKGVTWQPRNNGLPHTYVWNMKYIEAGNDKIIFATLPTIGAPGNVSTFQGGIYKSTDKGLNWNEINGNLPKMQSDGMFYYYWKFTVNPLNPSSIYIGTSVGYPDESLAAYEDWGIYKTENGGDTWDKVDNNVTEGWMDQSFFDERHALVLSIAPSDTNRIYWGRDWIYRSTNAGNSWEQIYTQKTGGTWKGNGFELMMAEGIAFSPQDANKIFVGYDDMGPFRSTDGGVTFKPLDPMMDPYDGYDAAKDILIDPDNGDIYMSRYDGIGSAFTNGYTMGRIYKSADGGDTFTNISNGFPDGRPNLAVDFKSGSAGSRTLYAASFVNGVYKSTDSGNSWTAINSGLGADAAGAWLIKIDPNNHNELYLGINNFGNGGALYKSINAGASWSKLSSFPNFDVLSLAIDKTNNIIYCGATGNYDWSVNGALFKSTDGGNTWSQISGLPRVADITINPDNPDILFIVSQPWYSVWLPDVQPGIFKSTDAGNTWQNITDNLNHAFVLFAKLNPNNTSQLFVGTGGGGLWVNDNATGVDETKNSIPTNFYLSQNYPNPFNPTTEIHYELPENTHVVLQIVNILGERVKTLLDKDEPAGVYAVQWDGTDDHQHRVSSGVYLYRIEAGDFVAAKKMILIK